MGINACWIQVLARKVAPATIREHVEQYWLERGAQVLNREWRPLKPYQLDRTGVLGYALSPVDRGWITLCDSERYTADHALASHLADALRTAVRFYGYWDATQQELDVQLGPQGNLAPPFPYRDLYYANLDVHDPAAHRLVGPELQGFEFVTLGEVDAGAYDPGPEPEDDDSGAVDPYELYLVAKHSDLDRAVRMLKRCASDAARLSLLRVFLASDLVQDSTLRRRFMCQLTDELLKLHSRERNLLKNALEATTRCGADELAQQVAQQLSALGSDAPGLHDAV